MSEQSKLSIPPMEITYRDGATYVADAQPLPEQATKNYEIARQALSLGAHVVNAYPVYIGGQERVAMLKIASAEQGVPMGYTNESGEYGTVK